MIRVIMDDTESRKKIHESFDEEMTLKGSTSDISGVDEKPEQNPGEEARNGGSEEARDGDINNDSLEDNNRKKRHRRKHKAGKHHGKRKWKPYDQLSWEERRELDEKESKRACVKREERFASGHALAPYNTTQFIMEDHKEEGIPGGATIDNKDSNKSPLKDAEMSGSDEEVSGHGGSFYDSPDNEDDFLENDFSQAYKNAHAEQLQAMPKSDLVRDYIELETKVERMERRLRTIEESQNNNVKNNGQMLPFSSYSADVHNETIDDGKTVLNNKQFLFEEIKRLKQVNASLQNENKQLRSKKSSSND